MSQNHDNLDPYNRGGMWAFVFSLSFSFVFFIWVSFFSGGVNLGEIPEEVKDAMQADANAAAPAEPWVSSAAGIERGKKVYMSNCMTCHDASGKADSPTGKAMKARNLVEGNWKNGGDSIALFKTLYDGLQGTSMVSFKSIPKNDRWALVHFIRSITNNKGTDDPEAVKEFAGSAK